MLLSDGGDGNWAAYGRGHQSDHFSALDQINDGNVGKLGLAWSVDLPTAINTHSAPLAVDGVVYYAVGYSVVSAVDAVTGKHLWTFDPDVPSFAGDKLRTAWGIRGIGYWNGKIYTGTQDGRLIAIDASTGKRVWSVQTTQGAGDGRYITGAPLLFDGKVMIGHGGADFGAVRGYVTTYDAETGQQLWRFYTVPGDPGKGPDGAASDPVMARAMKTWTGQWWKYGGGGTAWNAMTYDAELDRVYVGTGNGYPWNQKVRSPGGGDNLFLCSILALDAKTGKYLWHYQVNPGESWDFNAAMDMALGKLKMGGKARRVLMQAPKNGFFYVIDRDTGKLISAEPIGKVTWATGVDRKTGRPIETPQARFPTGETLIFPGAAGMHNWMAMSYSPRTGLVYIPKHDLPGYYSEKGITPANWSPPPRTALKTGFQPYDTRILPDAPTGDAGALLAWDPVAQKARWSVPLRGAFNGGVASTGGNLVFQGTADGRFVAYAADTGKKLWSFDVQNGVLGQPIVFSAKGRQYVTLMTGYGGLPAATGPEPARFGWDYRSRRRLLTFALDGKATLPKEAPARPQIVEDSSFKPVPARVAQGSAVYGERCILCHGMGAVAAGGAPDLRTSGVPLSAEAFRQIVHGGMLKSAGMPQFDDLSDQELESLRHFIRFRAGAGLSAKKAPSAHEPVP